MGIAKEAREYNEIMQQDACEMGAEEFCSKYGKSNLHIYDRVRDKIDRSLGAYNHLIHLLHQAKRYVEQAPQMDFTRHEVQNWTRLYHQELERVLSMSPFELEENSKN